MYLLDTTVISELRKAKSGKADQTAMPLLRPLPWFMECQ